MQETYTPIQAIPWCPLSLRSGIFWFVLGCLRREEFVKITLLPSAWGNLGQIQTHQLLAWVVKLKDFTKWEPEWTNWPWQSKLKWQLLWDRLVQAALEDGLIERTSWSCQILFLFTRPPKFLTSLFLRVPKWLYYLYITHWNPVW